MKTFLLITQLSVLVLIFVSQGNAFVYNDHGKQDPFVPLVSSSGVFITHDGQAAVVDIKLEGIILDSSGNNLAIINNKVVKQGDKIGMYTVEMVANDRVNLLQGEERVTIKLKKGTK